MSPENDNNNNNNPVVLILKKCENIAQCVQTHFLNFITGHHHSLNSRSLSNHGGHPLFSISSSPSTTSTAAVVTTTTSSPPKHNNVTAKDSASANPVTKQELGRATWTLLHTLAAQFPDHPTRQQKKDVKELMAILSRLYPCQECADHFKDVLSANPVQAGSQAEFSGWLCHVHNVVNRSLGKLVFPCQRVDARWGKLECRERACDLEGTSKEYKRT